jgi:hypothetical protein
MENGSATIAAIRVAIMRNATPPALSWSMTLCIGRMGQTAKPIP